MTTQTEAAPTRVRWWLEISLLSLLALATRLTYLDRPPKYDEMYHVLAASSVVEDGTLSINEGRYTRARLFTLAVAGSYRLFGETMVSARIPSLLAGTLWVVLVFTWMRRCGAVAAWTAAGLLCLAPGHIYLSQLCRFYAVHGLLVWVVACAIWTLTTWRRPTGRDVAVSIAGIVGLALAFHLQATTVIAMAGLGSWVAVTLAWRLATAPLSRRRRIAWTLVTVVVALAAGATLVWAGWWDAITVRARWSPLWTVENRDYLRFYFDVLNKRYAVLWGLLPLAFLVALARDAARTCFVTLVFGVAFVLHSFAGAKDPRYVAYALPFFFCLWGLALGAALPWVTGILRDAVRRAWPRSEAWAGPLAAIAVGAGVLFAMYTCYGIELTRRIVTRSPWDVYGGGDWAAAAPTLRPVAESVDVVLTSMGPAAQFFLGGYDVEINASSYSATVAKLPPGATIEPVLVDPRLGRPVIYEVEALDRIMSEHASGLVIVDRLRWDTHWAVRPDVVEHILARTRPIPLDPVLRLHAFTWPADPPPPADGGRPAP
ncbi:MAG: hypothetical protein ACYTG1_10015 [Planctomycetota bacterium]|jgi:hypothetical protein